MELESTKVLCIGEVLWDVLPSGAKPGGAPMNVALHLNAIGMEVSMVSSIGDDELGKELNAFMTKSGLDISNIQVDKALPTSTVQVHLDENSQATYEICKPVAWDNITYSETLAQKAKESGVIVFGTLASRSEASKNTIHKVLDSHALKLLDVNLRQPYDSRELVEPLLEKSDVIKVNDDELKVFAEWFQLDTEDEKELLNRLADKFNAQLICVTKGDKGASLFCDGKLYTHSGFKINMIDSVGAGDAFLAGLVASIIQKKSYEEALSFACATGAFVASKAGATPAYDMNEINEIIQANSII